MAVAGMASGLFQEQPQVSSSPGKKPKRNMVTLASVALSAPGLGNDVVARLCRELGLRFEDKHLRLQSAFGADAADRVEYTRVLAPAAAPAAEATPASAGGPVEQVDLIVIPSGNDPPRAPNESN